MREKNGLTRTSITLSSGHIATKLGTTRVSPISSTFVRCFVSCSPLFGTFLRVLRLESDM